MNISDVIVTYEGQDVNYNGTWYTRVLRKGSGGMREWIRKSSLPEAPIVDNQYTVAASDYRVIHI